MKALIASLTLLSAFSTWAESITKYDWVTMGEKSGEMVVTHHDDGKINAEFEFNDRGRGPKISEQFWLDDQGMIIRQEVKGHSYMGAPADEVFALKDNVASWKNTMEDETRTLTSPMMYSAANGTPYGFEILVKALRASESGEVAMLPSGTASMETILTTEVSNGDETRKVSLIAVKGFGFSPSYGWFNPDDTLYGFSFGWMGMAPEGWGSTLEALQKLQDKASDDFVKKQSQTQGQALSGITLINNVNVYTASVDALMTDTQVALQNGKILAVGADAAKLKADQTIDGKGRTLMPGLWDMHAHVSLEDGFLNIANGVTSVRDLANNHETVMQATELFGSAEAIGPSIYRAGFIDQKSPYSAPTGMLADTLEQALEHIDWYADHGYQQIKIYSSITPAWVPDIAKRVHKRGMKLSGHIPSYMTAEQAVKDGFDEIQHINMVFLNFLAGPEDDTRTPVRFTLVGDEAGQLDLNSQSVNDFIALLKAKGTIVDPTVTIFESMFMNKAGEINPSYAAIADNMPAEVRRGFLSGELDINADNEANYRASFNALLAMIKKLHDAGVPLVPGTDAMVGFTLHRELELYAEAGINHHDVLNIATAQSARIAGQQNVGEIKPGYSADIILLEGNPLEDISAIRKVSLVIKGDRMYQPASMFESIGITPFTAH